MVESYTTPNRPMRTVLREKILKHYRGISRCEALLWILCILYMVTFIYGWMNQKALASSGAGGKLTDLLLKPEDVPNE